MISKCPPPENENKRAAVKLIESLNGEQSIVAVLVCLG
jgi:hypothetical protein